METRVLHICDKLGKDGSTIHGVGRLLACWFPRLKKLGFAPTMCVIKSQDSAGRYLEQQGIEIKYLNCSKYDPRIPYRLARLLAEEKPDILHLHGYGAWIFGRLAARAANIPFVLHEHMVGQSISWLQQVLDRMLSGREPVIVPSKPVAQFCVEDRFVNAEDISIMPSAVPIDEFSQPSTNEIDAARIALDIKPHDNVVGSVGRLDPIKGYKYLVSALPEILSDFPDTKLLIVGDGEEKQELLQLAKDLGIESNFRFPGFWPGSISPIIGMMDVFAISSLSEGLPLTLIEAMVMGRPIVSTRAGGLADALTDGENALLVRDHDATDLARKIVYLLENPDSGRKLGVTARRQALEYYDINAMTKQIAELYARQLHIALPDRL